MQVHVAHSLKVKAVGFHEAIRQMAGRAGFVKILYGVMQ